MASQEFGTGDSLFVPNDDTDLGWAHTFLSHGYYQLGDGLGGVSDPFGDFSFERGDSGADTLAFSFALDSSHLWSRIFN